MKIVYQTLTTVIQLSEPVTVQAFNGTTIEVVQVKYKSDPGELPDEIGFGGYTLRKDGQRHATIPFRFYVGSEEADALALKWFEDIA